MKLINQNIERATLNTNHITDSRTSATPTHFSSSRLQHRSMEVPGRVEPSSTQSSTRAVHRVRTPSLLGRSADARRGHRFTYVHLDPSRRYAPSSNICSWHKFLKYLVCLHDNEPRGRRRRANGSASRENGTLNGRHASRRCAGCLPDQAPS